RRVENNKSATGEPLQGLCRKAWRPLMSPKETNTTAAATPLRADARTLSPSPAISEPTPPSRPLQTALEYPRYEVIPVRGALAEARKLPEGATVSVTCSPNRGIAPTIRLAEEIKN